MMGFRSALRSAHTSCQTETQTDVAQTTGNHELVEHEDWNLLFLAPQFVNRQTLTVLLTTIAQE